MSSPARSTRPRCRAGSRLELLACAEHSGPTPLPCGKSRESVNRSDLAGHADYGYCTSHSRFFWGIPALPALHPRQDTDHLGTDEPEARRARSHQGTPAPRPSPDPARASHHRRQGLRRPRARNLHHRRSRRTPDPPRPQRHETPIQQARPDTTIDRVHLRHPQRPTHPQTPHYNDAISIDMLRTEQKRLDAELLTVTRKLRDLTADFTRADGLITQALDLAQYIGASYRQAPEQIRRMFNQLIFEKIKITHDEHGQHRLEAILQPPFDLIFAAATRTLVAEARLRSCPENRRTPTASDERPSELQPQPVVLDRGLSRSIVVDLRGLEPLTPCMPCRCATSCATDPDAPQPQTGPRRKLLEFTLARDIPLCQKQSATLRRKGNHRAIRPEPFQTVIHPLFRVEYVQHKISKIEQDPPARGVSLTAANWNSHCFQCVLHRISDRDDIALRVSGHKNEYVGERKAFRNIKHHNIFAKTGCRGLHRHRNKFAR